MTSYRRKSWRSEMAVRVDVNAALDAVLGEAGLAVGDLEAMGPRIAEVHQTLEVRSRELFRQPHDKKAVQQIQELAREVRSEFDTMVVLGIGGSTLGTRALYASLCPPFHGWRPGGPESGARLIVADNVDPRTFGAILDEVDLHRTAFNVISKSGETTETMGQFLVVRERLLKVLGAVDYAQRVVITTDPEAGALRQIVNDEGFRSLPIPPGITGHFSVLSTVGLFPAAVAGIDIQAILAGAAHMEERCREPGLFENPAYLQAVVGYLAHTRRKKMVRMLMPYSDGLSGLAEWFAQLWCESLGRTTLAVPGIAGQHSHLELLTGEPDDKIVTFLRVEDHGVRLDLPEGYADLESVSYLGGRTLGDLLNLEQRATESLLARRGRMSTTVQVPAVNAYTLGQLIVLFEAETLAAAELERIDPFRQSAIEEGKALTAAIAGRKGFEETRAELQAWMQKKSARFVV